MKIRIMGTGILITILFMGIVLPGATNVSQFHSTPLNLASNDPQEMCSTPRNSSSAIIALCIFRLAINPTFSKINGLGLPDKEGKYSVRIISNLHWTASGLRSMIFSYNPLSLRAYSHTGSTSGQSMFYVGSVKIKANEGLLRSTEYTFIGIVFSLKITT